MVTTKALTLHGVHAWNIMFGGKIVENRSWPPNERWFGKRIAIHAGSNPGSAEAQARARAYGKTPAIWPRAVILGTVQLLGVICYEDGEPVFEGEMTSAQADEAVASRWWVGPIGWVLADPRPLTSPIPCGGKLGLWNIPADIQSQLTAASAETPPRPKGTAPASLSPRGDGTASGARQREHNAEQAAKSRSPRGKSSERRQPGLEPASSHAQIDGNMRVSEIRGKGYEPAIAAMLSTPIAAIEARLRGASGTMKLGKAFGEEWPNRLDELANWTVAFANKRGIAEELANHLDIKLALVKRRLSESSPSTLLQNAFGIEWRSI